MARVLANRPVCADHYAMRLALEEFPPTRPGQFIHLLCGDNQPLPGARALDWPERQYPHAAQPELAGRRPLLRRPFSLAGRRDVSGGVELDLIQHVVGVGTAWLAELAGGATVSVMGPLGNAFTIRDDRPAAALLGGGAGIPPMIYLAEALKRAGKSVTAFAGARSKPVLPLTTDLGELPSQAGWPMLCAGEFAVHGVPTVLATDDGSVGFPGLVTEAFERWLARHEVRPADLAVYACGPLPMLRAIALLCLERGIVCQVALERHMACGVGTCQGCVCKVRSPEPPGWRYRLVCRDGPVFGAEEIVW